MGLIPETPLYFVTTRELHAWFAWHHAQADEVWLGFHRKDSGLPSLTYHEALDEALCWGWIDGIRKRWDGTSYVQRFTPRRARSVWSKINIAKVEALEAAGRMQPAGRDAFAARTSERSGVYSFERDKAAQFARERLKEFKSHATAWTYFAAQAPYYRRLSTHWVESAKREDTRQRRFEKLLHHSKKQERLPQFQPAGKSS